MEKKIQVYLVSKKQSYISDKNIANLNKYFSVEFHRVTNKELIETIDKKQHILIFEDVSYSSIDYSIIDSIKKINPALHTAIVIEDLDEKKAVSAYRKHFDYIFNGSYSDKYFNIKLKTMLSRKSAKYINEEAFVTFGPLHINRLQREVSVDDAIINTSNKEYKVLMTLINNKTNFITKEDIFSSIWGYEEDNTRIVDQYLHKIKKKFSEYIDFTVDRNKGIKIDIFGK